MTTHLGAGSCNLKMVQAFTCALLLHLQSKGRNIVSVTECFFSEKVLPLYSYALRGKKYFVRSTFKSWRHMSLLLVVASNGELYHEIVQGAENTVIFEGFIDRILYQNTPLVLMDNIAFHKNIRNNRGLKFMYTLPYSTELNLVENAFS